MKKKLVFKSILFITLFVITLACSKEEEARITANIQDIALPNDNTPVQIEVNSNVAWSAAFSENVGFFVSPVQGGTGKQIISIQAPANQTKEEKKSDLVITGGGAAVTIKVSQKSLIFSVSPEMLLFDSIVSSKTLVINSNAEWHIKQDNLPTWIKSISPTSGTGNTTVNISVTDNPDRKIQEHILQIEYARTWSSIILRQKAAHNNPPTKPSDLRPVDNNISLMPIFSWTKSDDQDNDKIEYTVLYSLDRNTWQSVYAGTATQVSLSSVSKILLPNTKYFFKVKADDGSADGIVESDVAEFRTGSADAYSDRGYTIYQQSTKGSPIQLIFTGDGYLAEHYKYGGLFDQNVNEAIEALFSVQPYKEYREYFTVYKVAAYSAEVGISDKKNHVTRNTVFSSTLTGGTGIECNYNLVFDYAQSIAGITADDLAKTSVCIIINADVYAGTCYTISDGRSVAMVPVSRQTGMTTTFGNVVCHEYGGHGFGRLADEYINYETTIPEEVKQNLLSWQGYGYFKNVSPYAVESQVPWYRFFNKPDYGHVGLYTGGYLYTLGVTRSEYVSCMVDNRLYFNTQSRYLIVERILQVAGEGELTYDKFYRKDVQKSPMETKSFATPKNFVPLAPPILVLKER